MLNDRQEDLIVIGHGGYLGWAGPFEVESLRFVCRR